MSATASILFGIASMLGFGVADFIAKALLTKTNAIRTALISQGMGSLLYLGVVLAYDRALPSVALLSLALFSGLISGAVLCAYYVALSLGKASLVAPIFSCLTVVAVVLSFLILGEALTLLQLSAIMLVVLGIILVAFERNEGKDSSRELSLLLALAAAFFGGANLILQKWISESGHYLMGFFLTRISSAALMTPLALAPGQETRSVENSRSWLKLGVLGLIDVSAFFAWYIGLRVGLVSIVTPIATSSPAVTVILAHLFLKERVLPHQRMGIFAIIVGIVFLAAIS
jgi:drug/metabolite transporter (DMT)-like permease